jgi:hypothetical protein
MSKPNSAKDKKNSNLESLTISVVRLNEYSKLEQF